MKKISEKDLRQIKTAIQRKDNTVCSMTLSGKHRWYRNYVSQQTRCRYCGIYRNK